MLRDIDLGIERISKVMKYFDNCHLKYPTIHVSGTNGKGSVVKMISSVFQYSGYKVGSFTSPGLISDLDDITINDRTIYSDTFSDILKSVSKVSKEIEVQLTHFEMLTAISFIYFYEEKVDVAVIEVGMGGLLDATNIINPQLSIITNISDDHCDFLGGSIESVLEHKLGIVKKGTPLVTGHIEDRYYDKISKVCTKKGSIWYRYEEDFYSEGILAFSEIQMLKFVDINSSTQFDYNLKLLGEMQIKNSAIAIKALLILKRYFEKLDKEKIIFGIQETFWPCRFEFLKYRNHDVILDGAHNVDGAIMLRKMLNNRKKTRYVFIIGMLRDKNYSEFVKQILNQNDIVIVSKPQSERACDPQIIYNCIQNEQKIIIDDYIKALHEALSLAEIFCCDICITGSLYMVGFFRQIIVNKE